MKSSKTVIITSILSLVMYVAQSNGAVFEVTSSAELQAALDSARTNGEDDIIYLQQGDYTTASDPFVYGTTDNDNNAVTLSGGWDANFVEQDDDPQETHLDGGGANPVLQIFANAPGVDYTFEIENLTIENGYTSGADYSGSGILAYAGGAGNGSIHLIVRNCIFQNNNAANNKSGTIYSNSTLEFYDTSFLSNRAYNGGAMVISYDSDANQSTSHIIEDCYFEDNSNYGNQGSTIWTNCVLKISNCTFKGRLDESDSGPGSCIWGNDGSHLYITNSVFSGLRIQYWGSAIQAFNGAMDITNCLFADNHAGLTDGYGTIAYYHNGNSTGVKTINITNCTFTKNTDVASYAAAIHNRGAIMNINNSIFWDNDGDNEIINESGTMNVNYCDTQDNYSGTGNFSLDPMFISSYNSNYQLAPSSPCIDAGSNTLVPADSQDIDNDGNTIEPTPLDLEGMARFLDAPYKADSGVGPAPIVDIGAYEIPSAFGTINGKNVKLTLADCDGNNVTFTLTGGGYGLIDPCDCAFGQIELYDTTAKSVLTIATKGKIETSVGDISSNGPLKSITAKTTDLRGDITVDGPLGSLTLDDVADDHTITIGSSSDPKAGTLMKFDEVSDLTIDSDMPIKTLTATDWDGGAINAPSLGSITIAGNKKTAINGDFACDLSVDGDVGSIKIAGDLQSDIIINGSLGTLTLDDVADNHTITIGSSSDPKSKVKVAMTFDRVSDLTINSDTPINSITAAEWLDSDGTPDEVNVPSINALSIKGNTKAGIDGDFAGALSVDGDVGSIKIAGALSNTSTIGGSVSSATINNLQGDLIIGGNAANIKINHTMAVSPPEAGEEHKLHVEGTATVKAGKDTIKFTSGDLYANEPNMYRLEDLRRYDVQGAWWQYQATIKGAGSETFSVEVAGVTNIGGQDCNVVTASSGGVDFSTAWYTDSEGTHLAGWGISDEEAEINLELNSPLIAPEFLQMGQQYKDSGAFTGEFTLEHPVLGTITGDVSGTVDVSCKLKGHEQVSVPFGTYLAAKVETAVTMKGKMTFYYNGNRTVSFSFTQKQTCWAVPEVGVVKAVTNVSMNLGGTSVNITETDLLTDYGD